jgi:hypothetical protein
MDVKLDSKVETQETPTVSVEELVDIIQQQTSIGGLIGETGYTSASAEYRYLGVAQAIINNQIPAINLHSGEKLRIRDCSSGRGQAIAGLVKALEQSFELEIYVNDILDPQQLISQEVLDRLQNTTFTHQNLSDQFSDSVDIAIMGYVLPYLTPEQLVQAIENNLKTSKVLAITPARAQSLSDGFISTLFIWKVNGGYSYKFIDEPRKLK